MSMHRYWAERESRAGEIDVVCSGDFHAALASGKAVQFYELDYRTAKARMSERYPEADVWYTERNGDPITMLVPKGTSIDVLPSVAMDYMAIEWIDPDREFGTGTIPRRWHRIVNGANRP